MLFSFAPASGCAGFQVLKTVVFRAGIIVFGPT